MNIFGGLEIDYRVFLILRALIPCAALVILLCDLKWPARMLHFRNTTLLLLGALSFSAWANFGALNGRSGPIHVHDVYHYYLGSKYYAELGYTRIYRCTAVAEVESGRRVEVAQRWSRNLLTDRLEARLPTPAETDECRQRFEPIRWREFASDVEWFREHRTDRQWQSVLTDRGFNATPAWSTVGYWLSRWAPASDAQILSLALLDVGAILILWIVVWRTFGWHIACVALIWWGAAEGYSYLGGAFLRNDAYVCVALGICAMRVGRPALAGAALAVAALLRIFPIVLLAGLGVKVLYIAYRHGIPAAWTRYRRFATGCALTATALLALTALTWSPSWAGVLEPWHAFSENTRRHLGTTTPNQFGLRAVLSLNPIVTPDRASNLETGAGSDKPSTDRAPNVSARRALYWLMILACAAMFGLRARLLDDWALLVFAVALIPMVASLANYYYSIFLVFAFLWPLDRLVVIGLVALASFVRLLPAFTDTRVEGYGLTSVAMVLYCAFVLSRGAWLASSSEGSPHSLPLQT